MIVDEFREQRCTQHNVNCGANNNAQPFSQADLEGNRHSGRKTRDSDFTLKINVSGTEYALKKSHLERFPQSLLYRLAIERLHQQSAIKSSDDTAVAEDKSIHGEDKRLRLREAPDGAAGSLSLRTTIIGSASDRQHTTPPAAIFFQRSPIVFELVVLQSYVTGRVHVPRWMCSESALDELHFWQLGLGSACSCCAEESHSSTEDEAEDLTLNETTTESPESTTVNVLPEKIQESNDRYCSTVKALEKRPFASNSKKLRRFVWEFVSNPSSGIGALVVKYVVIFTKIFAVISFCFVLLSVSILTLESFRDITYCPRDMTCSTNVSKSAFYETGPTLDLFRTAVNSTTPIDSSINTEKFMNMAENGNGACGYFSACTAKRILQQSELAVIAWFTFELLLRMWSCPGLLKFVTLPLNIIDICSTVPFYIELAITFVKEAGGPPQLSAHSAIVLLQVVRCLRVLRILKLARYFEELRILGRTLRAARNELCMLFLFVLTAIFIFSSIVYQLEKDQPNTLYTSIPASAWFGIVTMTTVGYGDMIPFTIAGKVVSCIACITGVVITAFPVSILVEHFASTYKTKRKRMFIVPRFKRRVNISRQKQVLKEFLAHPQKQRPKNSREELYVHKSSC